MGRLLRIEPGACLLGAFCLYLLPLEWVLGAVTAGAVHEIFHLLALSRTGVAVYSVTVGGFGAKIESGPLDQKQELLCALAGPAGSFAVLLLCHIFPEAALWGLVQGLFNLLPLYPMDGGRALRCIFPERACMITETITIVLVLFLSLYAALVWRAGVFAWFFALALAISIRGRKIPCKQTKKAVQ